MHQTAPSGQTHTENVPAVHPLRRESLQIHQHVIGRMILLMDSTEQSLAISTSQECTEGIAPKQVRSPHSNPSTALFAHTTRQKNLRSNM